MMRRSIVRLALVAGLTAVFGGAGAGTASAQSGCIGFPSIGGAAYHCLTINPGPILPKVNPTGTTPVGATVPAFCYFLGCTPRTPLSVPVPVAVDVSRPAASTTLFRLSVGCTASNNPADCSSNYYVYYYGGTDQCFFESDDPAVAAINRTHAKCVL